MANIYFCQIQYRNASHHYSVHTCGFDLLFGQISSPFIPMHWDHGVYWKSQMHLSSLQVLPSLMTAQKMTTKRKANILLSCHKKVCNNISIHIHRWNNSFLRAELALKLITNPLAHLPHHFHCESTHPRY